MIKKSAIALVFAASSAFGVAGVYPTRAALYKAYPCLEKFRINIQDDPDAKSGTVFALLAQKNFSHFENDRVDLNIFMKTLMSGQMLLKIALLHENPNKDNENAYEERLCQEKFLREEVFSIIEKNHLESLCLENYIPHPFPSLENVLEILKL